MSRTGSEPLEATINSSFVQSTSHIFIQRKICNMDMPPTPQKDFNGWEIYPQNLPTAQRLKFAYDVVHYDEALRNDSKRIFAESDEETLLQVTHIGTTPQKISGSRELQKYLTENKTYQGCRVILIPQFASVSNLLISEAGIRKLLTHICAFPPLLDLVRAFGRKNGEEERSGTPFVSRSDEQGELTESCWLLQHVERHGRTEQSDPWSIRQMGSYLRVEERTKQQTFIILNPLIRFQQRLKEVEALDSCTVDIQLLLLSSTCCGWREYLDYLESRLDILNNKIKQIVNYDVQFSDTLEVQNLRHKLALARTAIGGNVLVLSKIAEQEARSGHPHGATSSTADLKSIASSFRTDLESLLLRADNLMIRLDGAASLVGSILDLHAAQAAQASNEKAERMALLAKADNELMVDMTKRSVADARTLKTITVLTLIYLPASFVSTFLGMNYVKIDTDPIVLHCRPEMIIFGILTVILLLITVGFWLVSEYRQRRKESEDEAIRRLTMRKWP